MLENTIRIQKHQWLLLEGDEVIMVKCDYNVQNAIVTNFIEPTLSNQDYLPFTTDSSAVVDFTEANE